MAIDFKRARTLLKQLDLQRLFVEELNWANPTRSSIAVATSTGEFRLNPLAEQGGMVIFRMDSDAGKPLPDRKTRLAIHKQLLPQAQEHIIVFVNEPGTATIWMWVEREGGKRKGVHEHRYHTEQTGDSLLQKLEGLAFNWDDLDEEGRASIVQVTDRVKASLATTHVTKRFYDEFKKQHNRFLAFIEGIDRVRDGEWYASIMLNRLMFIYFIQRKQFLDADADYLRARLSTCQTRGVPYYRGFLTRLFFEGFACKPEERSPEANAMLGEVPYLNGGIFLPHEIEQANGGIDIPDEAFEKLFDFFDQYQWHLDDRPLRADNEINPDVLGYIFEKYINQKQMGAYYTKEDITEYITKNTALPSLFDKLKHFRPEAVEPLPISDIELYIHDAVKQGVDLDLPPNIAAGLDDVSQRTDWNRAANAEFALPTETWREHIARRQRYRQILDDFAAGKITTINDFITYNLDIIKFAHDFISDTQDPLTVRAFYFECLKTITILDPTCGSGAFLFAALNILEPLYEICLERMEEFLVRKQRHPQWAQPFEAELERLAEHPSRSYFIYKSIIVNNLYGVDIMEEAVEICRLRLFLKLVAQVEDVARVEPLPDIDFNIQPGNTLVGYASLEEIEQAKAPGEAGTGKMDFGGIVDRVKAVDRNISNFRNLQMQSGISAQHFREAKANLQAELQELETELNRDLAFEYGYTQEKDIAAFETSHRPFHWYVQFYDIMTHGGFDVIIGNPPFVEYTKVSGEYAVIGYTTQGGGNLYCFVTERSLRMTQSEGRVGLVLPISVAAAQRMRPVQQLLFDSSVLMCLSNFALRPAALFPGTMQRISIAILQKGSAGRVFTTDYITWYAEEREHLFDGIRYCESGALRQAYSIPKANNEIACSALRKMLAQGSTWRSYREFGGEHSIYYHNAGGYWVKTFRFEPYYRSLVQRDKRHTTISALEMPTIELAETYLSVLNSNTFYFFWKSLTDARHVYPSDIAVFPLRLPLNSRLLAQLSELNDNLIEAYQANCERIVYGQAEVDQYSVLPCKPIIDEIDRVLAEHYGFTDEELDFIINYDIKYRMGGPDERENA